MTPLSEVIAGLKRNRLDLKFALEREVRVGMEAGAKVAQGFIGRDDTPGWAPLSDATLADKERGGYATPHVLERTGSLKESIVGEAETLHGEVVGIIGTNNPTALWHELGTSREPPRPFLGPALVLTLPALGEALAALAVRTLTPGRRP